MNKIQEALDLFTQYSENETKDMIHRCTAKLYDAILTFHEGSPHAGQPSETVIELIVRRGNVWKFQSAALELGIKVKLHEGTRLFYVHVPLTEKIVSEYAESMEYPLVDIKTYPRGYKDGAFVYLESNIRSLNSHLQFYIDTHQDEFFFRTIKNPRITAVTPKGKPEDPRALNQMASLMFLTSRVIRRDIEAALTIAYGGEWDALVNRATLRPHKTIMQGVFTDRKASALDESIKAAEDIERHVQRYKVQAKKYKKLVKVDSDASRNSNSVPPQLQDDMIKAIPLKAAFYVQHRNEWVRNFAMAALINIEK